MRVFASTVLACVAAFAVAASPSTSDALRTIASKAEASHSDAVLVQQGTRTLLDTSTDTPVALMSATKSIVALAIGLLIDDGRLASLDTPVSAIYPEWAQGRKRAITVRMLLDHTSGLQNVANAGVELEGAPDLVQLALAAELDSEPGAAFAYNNKATNLLTGIVGTLAGEPIDAYLGRRLFAPLGITGTTWMRDAAGTPMGMAGLAMSARDLAKIGRLVLDRGLAPDGTRLLAADYVDRMLAPGARSPEVGLLWWRNAAWERFTLRAEAAGLLEAKSVAPDVRAAVLATAGRTFDSRADLVASLARSLGAQWADRYGTEITARGIRLTDLFETERGPVRAFSANGFLGQYLVIVPERDLVAVRQIERRDTHVAADDYPDFVADVLRLADSLR